MFIEFYHLRKLNSIEKKQFLLYDMPYMKILAIETSCDDTGISILEARGTKSPYFKVLSNIVSSQIEIHKKYGGVFPMMAKREHQKNLVSVLTEALKKSGLLKLQKSKIKNKNYNVKLKTIGKILERESELFLKVKDFLEKYERPNIDLIAVTNGPGLEPCLWVGVNFAKVISYFWDIPIVTVNHIEAHILVNFLENKTIEFPVISLIVSGGHTQLILMKKIGDYKIIGETRDDAAGECFDKAAKILGLDYPGGPIISKIASQIKKSTIKLPRPMINSKDYDFSFSGLKTAVLYKVKEIYGNTPLRQGSAGSDNFVSEMCFEVQQAIVDVLIKKTIQAAKDFRVKTIILGGGVSANQELRRQLKEKIKKDIPDTKYLIPNTSLSTDNALMIAVAGYFHKNKIAKNWSRVKSDSNLRID